MYRSRTSIRNARTLRRSATDVENRLWSKLRSGQMNGVRFRRQHPIGRYVVDFCAPSLLLVVELDGGQHAERAEQDAARTRRLEAAGYHVLRFWNSEVTESLEAVLERIREEVENRRPGAETPPPRPASGRPLPKGER